MPIYVDTSALVKRYVSEPGSDAFDAFLASCDDSCIISSLGSTELESVLQRLKRLGHIDPAYADQARGEFVSDLNAALWSVHAFVPLTFARAAGLMRSLDFPLATLDALHLASALEFRCDRFATSDRQLFRAASECGLAVHDFSD